MSGSDSEKFPLDNYLMQGDIYNDIIENHMDQDNFEIIIIYLFNLEGFIFSSVLLVVSIYMIIAGYKKGIKKGSALWQVTFYLSIMLLLLVLFLFYIHYANFSIKGFLSTGNHTPISPLFK